MYPDIQIFLFFGVHMTKFQLVLYNVLFVFARNVPRYFKYCLFWGTYVQIIAFFIQHMVYVCEKRTPIFQFYIFLGYGCLFALFIHRLTPQQIQYFQNFVVFCFILNFLSMLCKPTVIFIGFSGNLQQT